MGGYNIEIVTIIFSECLFLTQFSSNSNGEISRQVANIRIATKKSLKKRAAGSASGPSVENCNDRIP